MPPLEEWDTQVRLSAKIIRDGQVAAAASSLTNGDPAWEWGAMVIFEALVLAEQFSESGDIAYELMSAIEKYRHRFRNGDLASLLAKLGQAFKDWDCHMQFSEFVTLTVAPAEKEGA